MQTLLFCDAQLCWQVAIEEVRRLQRFGVTAGELERYKMALLRDSAQAAEQALSVPSADQLDFIMESLALGHTVLDQRQVGSCALHISKAVNMCLYRLGTAAPCQQTLRCQRHGASTCCKEQRLQELHTYLALGHGHLLVYQQK